MTTNLHLVMHGAAIKKHGSAADIAAIAGLDSAQVAPVLADAVASGRLLEVEPVAELVLDAIRRNTLYIHTHSEAAEFFGKRAARISAAFADAL